MNRHLFLIIVALVFSTNAMASNLYCGNKNRGLRYFTVILSGEGARLSVDKIVCQMVPTPYKPRSAKYQGWIRVAPQAGDCVGFGKAVAGSAATFLSLSPEVARGEEGFAQLGYANVYDAGSGSELKADLRCFVKN